MLIIDLSLSYRPEIAEHLADVVIEILREKYGYCRTKQHEMIRTAKLDLNGKPTGEYDWKVRAIRVISNPDN